ncbi:DUF5018 domain-containing protein [Zunongwangia sp.]|uniref:DUF5018 domain-containing protein n=1 Tax=Zunongwangia sp. TaxID=1965325 RepID=UPI003AA8CB41
MMKNALLILVLSVLFFNCSKDDDRPSLSSENKILSFKIEVNNITYSGNINNVSKEVRIQTLGLENFISVTPSIEISANATINPTESTPQNFNNIVNYTVTAENGEIANYQIITENTPFSNEKQILSFELNIDNESFIGNINHNDLTIDVETYKDVSNVSPIITISENATISPNPNEIQNFNNPIEYTVTAQDGTNNTYTVNILKREINSTVQKCYVRATSFGRVTYLDLSNQDYQLYIENETNSYHLNFFDTETWNDNGIPTTNFYFYFDENIETAVDYKLKLKINGQTKAETSYEIDVLKENAPKINSANQQSYNYNDTLILTGENLVPGLRIPANGNIYQYNESYVSVSSDQTILTFPMTLNYQMFPSWVGQSSPRPTRVNIYYDGRYGDSTVLDFN